VYVFTRTLEETSRIKCRPGHSSSSGSSRGTDRHQAQQQQQGLVEGLSGGNSSSKQQQEQQGREAEQQVDARGLLACNVSAGDFLLLSAEGLQVAVGRVTVAAVTPTTISVVSRRQLQLERYLRQAPPSACDVAAAAGVGVQGLGRLPDTMQQGLAQQGHQQQQQCDHNQQQQQQQQQQQGTTWRLDKDEVASMGQHMRSNLLTLATSSSPPQVERLRQLIIEQQPPRQQQLPAVAQQEAGDSCLVVEGCDLPQQEDGAPAAAAGAAPAGTGSCGSTGQQQTGAAGCDAAAEEQLGLTAGAAPGVTATQAAHWRARVAALRCHLQQHGGRLNEEQQEVLQRVAAAEDYVLVLGMPGASAHIQGASASACSIPTGTCCCLLWILCHVQPASLCTGVSQNARQHVCAAFADPTGSTLHTQHTINI
jgi:hypothetical protein